MDKNNFLEYSSLKFNDSGHAGEMFFALKERVFEIRDLGISAKIYSDWKAQQLIPPTLNNPILYNKKVRLSYYEAIWFMLLSDLRELGVRYNPHLKFLMENCWRQTESSFEKSWLVAYQKFKYPGNEDLEAVIANLKVDNAEGLKRDIPGFKVYGFEFRIFQDLFQRLSTRLFIRRDKLVDLVISKETDVPKPPYLYDEKRSNRFADEVFIEIPLMRYIRRFINDEQLVSRQLATGKLSKAEEELLAVIRKGQIKTLEIHFDKRGIKPVSYHIEKEKALSAEEFATVRNTILLKDYQQISYKATKGGGAYYTKKILKQLGQ